WIGEGMGKWTLVPATAVSVLCGFMIAGVAYNEHAERHGVIVEEIVAREGNAMTFPPAFQDPLAVGVEVQVLDERRGWTRLQIATDKAWVPSNTLVQY
ncbi:MAG: hypothetical protein KDA60_01150, partial [Planctomycetales bacterium]|nr:hypothetical protein [Planctomycetales bacterium]